MMNHFKINLVACLLNQIYVVPVPPPRYDYYDDPHVNVTDELIPSTSTGATPRHPHFHLQHDVLYIYSVII